MPSHYPRQAPSFPSTFSGQAMPVPSRAPSWVKSFWCPPSGKAQACSCIRPCGSVHHSWIGARWICLVRVPARHAALKAPHPSKSNRERHSSATQGECTNALTLLCMYAAKPSVQEPIHLRTVETGPPKPQMLNHLHAVKHTQRRRVVASTNQRPPELIAACYSQTT